MSEHQVSEVARTLMRVTNISYRATTLEPGDYIVVGTRVAMVTEATRNAYGQVVIRMIFNNEDEVPTLHVVSSDAMYTVIEIGDNK